jgi:hypothetical protein
MEFYDFDDSDEAAFDILRVLRAAVRRFLPARKISPMCANEMNHY